MIWLLLEYELVLTEFRRFHPSDSMDSRLGRLMELGNRCGPPASKHVRDQIWELRANSREGQLRLYYFFGPAHLQITVLHAVVKKRRKADPRDIDTAIRRRARIWSEQVKPNVYDLGN